MPVAAAAAAIAVVATAGIAPSAGAASRAVDTGWGESGFVQLNAGEALWAPAYLTPRAGGRLSALVTTFFLGGARTVINTGRNGADATIDPPMTVPSFQRVGRPGAAVRLPDGRIVTTAHLGENTPAVGTGFGVAALTPTGRPVASFGSGGVAVVPALDASGQVTSVADTPTGILAAGRTTASGDLAVARFSFSGALDESLGPGGFARVVVPDHEARGPVFVVALPDGRFAVAGTVVAGGSGEQRIAIARFDAGGRPEGQVSLARLAPGSATSALCGATFSRGRLLLVGSLGRVAGGADCPLDVTGRLRIARVNSDGFPDRTFNATGFQSVSFGAAFAGGVNPYPREGRNPLPVYVGADDRIVIGGALADDGSIAVARLLGNGRPDPSLGGGGRACTDVPRFLGEPIDGGALVTTPGPAGTIYAGTGATVTGDDSIITLMRLRAASRLTMPCSALRVQGSTVRAGGLLTVRAHLLIRVASIRFDSPGARAVKRTLGTVSLGSSRPGTFRRTWNLRLRGKPLPRGSYELTVLARPPGTRRFATGSATDIRIPR